MEEGYSMERTYRKVTRFLKEHGFNSPEIVQFSHDARLCRLGYDIGVDMVEGGEISFLTQEGENLPIAYVLTIASECSRASRIPLEFYIVRGGWRFIVRNRGKEFAKEPAL